MAWFEEIRGIIAIPAGVIVGVIVWAVLMRFAPKKKL
jgi:hypothetical protein